MDRRHLAGGAIIILLILVLLFGGGAFGPGEEGGAGEGEGGIITCDSDEDCPGEQECVAGICKEPGTSTCEENSDCPEGQVCIEEFCFESDEIPCENTGDCPSGYECVEGFCKEIEPAGQGPLFCSSDEDCPDGEVCQNNACMSQEEADCIEQGGEWNEDTEDCTIECSEDEDCPEGEACHEGECMDPQEIPCDPPCKTGWVCVEGTCVLQAELYSPNSQFGFIQAVPMSYCEGCPQEDSIVSNMFLDPDIDEKTVSAVLFVEEEFGNRTLVEDATIFIQVVPSDGSETSTCRIVTGEDGKAIFDYSEYEICDEVGCRLRFTFCCANITEGCLLPVCLSDNAISHYTEVSPCGEGPAGEWPEEAYVDGEFFNIYPAVQELSIPAQPQVIGTAFTFDLCFPVMVIFALLSAAMFATGRNPFRMFSLYTPRFKRAPMRAIRARGMTFNTTSIISGIVSASRGIGKEAFDAGDKVKMLKDGMKGSKKTKKEADEAGEAAQEGRVAMADTSAVQTVGERGDTREAGRGASGADLAPGAPQGVMSLGPDTEGLHRYGLMPDENGKGPSGGKVFGTMMGILGNAILTKILTSSPLLSWLAYGWGDFKGVTSTIREKMYDKAASEVMEWAGNALDRLEFERKTDPETGEIVITHVDPASGQRMERRFDQTVEGRGEAARYTSEIGVTPTLILYNKSANIVLKQISEEGSPLLEECENAVEQTQEKFGVSVGEEISYTSASVELDHPEISEGDVPGLILRAEDLQEGGGTNLFDKEATTEWVMGLQTRAMAGEEIPQSELRLAAEVYRRGIDELGSGGLIEHSNLAHLGHALVDATANTGMGTETPSPDSLAFAEYAQAMVASTAAGTDPALTQKALGTLTNTHESAGAMIGEPLYGVGELEPHVLKNIEEGFSGEADPARYGAALDAQRESQQLIEAQARDLVYAGVTKKGPEGREEIYDDGSIYHVIHSTPKYFSQAGVQYMDEEAAKLGLSKPPSELEQEIRYQNPELSQDGIDTEMQEYYNTQEPKVGVDVDELRDDARDAGYKYAYRAFVNEVDSTRLPLNTLEDSKSTPTERELAKNKIRGYVEKSYMDGVAKTIHGAKTLPSEHERIIRSQAPTISQEEVDRKLQNYYDIHEPDADINIANIRHSAEQAASDTVKHYNPNKPDKGMSKIKEVVGDYKYSDHHSAGSMVTDERVKRLQEYGAKMVPESERPEEVQKRILDKEIKRREARVKMETFRERAEWIKRQTEQIAEEQSQGVYHDSHHTVEANLASAEEKTRKEYEESLRRARGRPTAAGSGSPLVRKRKKRKPAKRGGKKRPKTKKPKKGGKKGEDT